MEKNINFFAKLKKYSSYCILSLLPKYFLFNQVKKIKRKQIHKLILTLKCQQREIIPQTKIKSFTPPGIIRSIAFSPCEKYLLVACDNSNKAFIYNIDMENRQLVDEVFLELTGHTNMIKSVAYSPAGDIVATGSRDCTVIIHCVNNSNIENYGKQIFKFPSHTDWVRTLTFSPCGKNLASGSHDKTVKIHCLDKTNINLYGIVIKSFTDHTDFVISISYNLNGKFLATGSVDRSVLIYNSNHEDTENFGKMLLKIDKFSDGVSNLKFSPVDDSLVIILWNDIKFFEIFEVNNNKDLTYNHSLNAKGHTSYISAVCFSPNGNYILSGGCDNNIIMHGPIYEAENREVKASIIFKNDSIKSIRALSYSASGSFFASGGDEKKINLYA